MGDDAGPPGLSSHTHTRTIKMPEGAHESCFWLQPGRTLIHEPKRTKTDADANMILIFTGYVTGGGGGGGLRFTGCDSCCGAMGVCSAKVLYNSSSEDDGDESDEPVGESKGFMVWWLGLGPFVRGGKIPPGCSTISNE